MSQDFDDGLRRYLIVAATTTYPPPLSSPAGLRTAADGIRRLFCGSFRHMLVPGFEPNLTAEALRDRLRAFLDSPDRRPDDLITFYYTGHGELTDGEFALLFPQTPDNPSGRVGPAEFRTWFLTARPVNLLVLLETCHAGGFAQDVIGPALNEYRAVGNVAVIAAARPVQEAVAAAFADALGAVADSPTIVSPDVAYLPLDRVTEAVNRLLPQFQRSRASTIMESGLRFLPNPRFGTPTIVRIAVEDQVRLLRDQEYQQHVLPRARGGAFPDEDLWLFAGRDRALGELADWTRRLAVDGRTRVVTGDPGSGKSSLLARLTVLADVRARDRVPGLGALPAGGLPVPGCVAQFVHARQRSTAEVVRGLAHATGLHVDNIDALIANLYRLRQPTLVVLDAIDEATQPDDLVRAVLQPLTAAAVHTPLRLLLGTRRHLVPLLGHPRVELDLDAEPYADPNGVRQFVSECLRLAHPGSGYATAAPGVLADTAALVARRAGRSFLVAALAARTLAGSGHVADPSDPHFLDRLPSSVGDAVAGDLADRLGLDADRARDLLLPLAYARGAGLPWENLWAPLASLLSGSPYTDTDVDWLLTHAGSYLVTATDHRRSVYRPHHEALAEHLRSARDRAADERLIAGYLRGLVSDGDWPAADPYVREYLAGHAAAAGVLDDLMVDPGFLLAAEPARLTAVLNGPGATTTVEGRAAGHAYRESLTLLGDGPRSGHAGYLLLTAHRHRAGELARALERAAAAGNWRPRWTDWSSGRQLRTISGSFFQPVDVRIVHLGDRPVAVLAANDHLSLYDPATGVEIGAIQVGGDSTALAVGLVAGRPCAVVGDRTGGITAWDLESGAPAGPPVQVPGGAPGQRVVSLAVTTVQGRAIILSGSQDSVLRIWDLRTGRPLGPPLTGHSDWIHDIAFANLPGCPAVVTVAEDGRLIVRDLTTGLVLRSVDCGSGHLESLDVVTLTSGPAAVVGAFCGTVRVYDLGTGSLLRELNRDGGIAWRLRVTHLDDRPVACVVLDRELHLWDLDTGAPVGVPYAGHSETVTGLALWTHRGQTFAVTSANDSTLRVWDIDALRLPAPPFVGHTDEITAVAAVILDGRHLAVTGSRDHSVRIWDPDTGLEAAPTVRGARTVTTLAATVVGGQLRIVIGYSDGHLRVTGSDGGRVGGEPPALGDWVTAVACASVGGRTVCVGADRDGALLGWDLDTGSPLGPRAQLAPEVRAVCVTRWNGRAVAVVAELTAVVTVDLATGRTEPDAYRREFPDREVGGLAILDGHPVALVARNDVPSTLGRVEVEVIDLGTGRPVGPALRCAGPQVVKRAVLTTAEGRPTLVVTDNDGGNWIGDPHTGQLIDGGEGQRFQGVAAAIIRRAGGAALLAGGRSGTLRVYDLADGTVAAGTHATGPQRAAMTSAGGHPVIVAITDHGMARWNLATGRPAWTSGSAAHSFWPRRLVTTHLRGRPVLVGSSSRGWAAWYAETGEPIGPDIHRAASDVTSMATCTIGGRPVLVTGSRGTVEVWDLETGHPAGPARADLTEMVVGLAVVRVGDRPAILAAGALDAQVRAWDLLTGATLGATPPVDNRVRLLTVGDGPAGQICHVVYHGGLVLAWALDTLTTPGRRGRAPEPLGVLHRPGDITTLLVDPLRGPVLAYGGTIEIGGRRPAAIELGATVTDLLAADRDTLVACTAQGLVVLDLPPTPEYSLR